MTWWHEPTARAGLALACLSGWMVLLFAGLAGGGAVHLLFVAALALFPWRALTASGPERTDRAEAPPEDERS